MKKEFIFIILFMLSSYFLKAQSLPGSLNSKLPKPSISNAISALPSKPEIPYLEELKQIQSLKQSYDSLKTELKEIKEYARDSTQKDSLFMVAKERGREVLEKESRVLESLIESEEVPGDEIRNAASRTLIGVTASKARLSEIQNFEGIEALMDQNGENPRWV